MSLPITRSKEALRLLHLIWAVPTAFLINGPLWVIAQWGWCDYASGRCGVVAATSIAVTAVLALGLLLVAGGLTCAILIVAPWTGNRRLRKSVAISSGAIVSVSGILSSLYWVLA